jgi:hypothetical protein
MQTVNPQGPLIFDEPDLVIQAILYYLLPKPPQSARSTRRTINTLRLSE